MADELDNIPSLIDRLGHLYSELERTDRRNIHCHKETLTKTINYLSRQRAILISQRILSVHESTFKKLRVSEDMSLSATDQKNVSQELENSDMSTLEYWKLMAQEKVLLEDRVTELEAEVKAFKEADHAHRELNRKLANHNADCADQIKSLELKIKEFKNGIEGKMAT